MGASPASAAPDDTQKVSQNSVVKTSPDILVYDNMFIGVPKSATLTIANVSGEDISITPFMDFGSEYDDILETNLELCSAGQCIPVTATTKAEIPKNGSQALVVTITLIRELPKELKSISVTNGLQVTGEVHSDEEIIEIVPQNRAPEGNLPLTGISPNLITIMGFAGLLVMVGYGLMTLVRKKRTEDETEKESA
jgi:LPXTG-motif cell wall-anchored protein